MTGTSRDVVHGYSCFAHTCTYKSPECPVLITSADPSYIPGESWALFGQHFSLMKQKAGGAQRAAVSQAGKEVGM